MKKLTNYCSCSFLMFRKLWSLFVDVDECAESVSPCLNGGTCINTEGGHNCTCPHGWHSENCEMGKYPGQSTTSRDVFDWYPARNEEHKEQLAKTSFGYHKQLNEIGLRFKGNV